jgi:hypothetical protein
LVGVIVALALPAAWRDYDTAVSAALAARARFDAALVDLKRLQDAERGTPGRTHEGASDTGETQRISEVAVAVGLPPSTLTSVSVSASPEARAGGDSSRPIRVDRLRATVAVNGATLPELGRFIAAWSESHPAWVVSAIDITLLRDQTAARGRDLPLQALLVFETMAVVPQENPG